MRPETKFSIMKFIATIAIAALSTSLIAQTTVTTGPSNALQTYYSLQNGVVSSVPLAEWDLAFEIVGITGSIMVNTAKGMQVYKAPYTVAQWAALDTAGLAAGWASQQNSETNWASGALNQGLTSNPFDLGWGVYNMVSHNITGDSLFVLKLADGSWKKLRIDSYAAGSDAFTFTWADPDGANEQVGSLVRANYAGKSFGYYSLATNGAVDHEPAAASWDLLFTKYVGYVTQPSPTFYPLVGVLQNRGVSALQVDGVPSASAQWWGEDFSTDINVIGADWKSFNMTTFQWEYAQDRTYFVTDRSGNIWKLVFTTYGGSANGDITFTKEMMSSVGVEEVADAGRMVLYPNPSNSGVVHVIMDATINSATLSIVDVNGRTIDQRRLTGLSGLAQQTINTSAFATGIYTVRLQGEGVDAVSRMVID